MDRSLRLGMRTDRTGYAHLKKDVFHEGKQGKILSTGELLLAAGTAGMPAAALTTPFVCLLRFDVTFCIYADQTGCRQDPLA
jgi:hypothetical protein